MYKKIIFTMIITAVVVGGVAVVFTLKTNEKDTTIKSNALLTKVTKEELLSDSDIVVVGEVVDVQSFKAASEIRSGKEDIFSDVTLQINEYIYNPKNFSESRVVVRIIGGSVDGASMIVSDGPTFDRGERVVVFLKQNDNQQIFKVVGWTQGKYAIIDNIVGKDNIERMFIQNIFGRDLTLDEFKKEVAKAVLVN